MRIPFALLAATFSHVAISRLPGFLFILYPSLEVDTNFLQTNEFEVLEFYGDACLYQTISQYIMTTRRFMNPHLMTQLRMSCIKNVNLAVVFDLLHLDQLLRVQGAMPVKDKADIVEAIIGELAEDEEETATLNEITAYIAYVGEKAFVHLQAEPPRPTSKNGRSLYSPPAAASAPAAPSQHAPTPHRRNDKEVPLLQPLFLLPTASQSAPAGTRPQLSAASSSDPQTSRSLEDRARTAAAVAPGRAQEATKKKKSQRGIVQTETTLNGVAYMTTQRPPLTAAAHKQPAKRTSILIR